MAPNLISNFERRLLDFCACGAISRLRRKSIRHRLQFYERNPFKLYSDQKQIITEIGLENTL